METLIEYGSFAIGCLTLFYQALSYHRPPLSITASASKNSDDGKQNHFLSPSRLRILGTCLALALTIIPPAIWHYESRIQGFNSGWPDAISCKAQLPELNGQSLYIFYYNGLSVGRRYFGSVVRYFLVGGFNDTKGYGPHEVWFLADQNKSLLRVQENLDVIKWMDEKGKEQKLGKSDLDPITQRYVETFLAFPGLDCGGDTINQVIVSGNAFSFARKL